MSKRSRATYEADLIQQQSPFVLYGTPLPPLDPEIRDDGSFVPVWKQEVRDEQGRKRLHGAFTGGWSAGYFNTVGSKEGWAPSTFVSSRTNRHKDKPQATRQRAEDFMDDEDLREAEEARTIQTNDAFAGLGSTDRDATRASGLLGLFRAEGETMGVKLLKKMGWKEGQGIGPKVRRKARLDLRTGNGDPGETFLFAPENVAMVAFTKKKDRKGLGHNGEAGLSRQGSLRRHGSTHDDEQDDDEDEDGNDGISQPRFTIGSISKKKPARKKGSIGMGVLNDTGSDDDDPYEMGPRISYNRVIGGEKKKKSATIAINPALKTKPKFIPKRSLAKVGLGVRKCHDGRLPLDGFILATNPDALTSAIASENRYAPPPVPPGWKSSKTTSEAASQTFTSAADAAKASTLDPKSRAALLGEQQLPGKSVFDFISPAAREQLARATGRSDLPEAKGEVPAGYALSEEEAQKRLLDEVPRLDKQAAIGAIARGTGPGAPYADNEEKRSRYRAYLEYCAGFRSELPPRAAKASKDDWLRELHEYFSCARIFKPMTGVMASRFTTSSSSNALATGSSGAVEDKELVTKPVPPPQDPAEEAAKLGMFGHLTRSTADFFPSRLLCKRFNVRAPEHVQPEEEAYESSRPTASSRFASAGFYQESPQSQAQSQAHLSEGTGPSPTVKAEAVETPAERVVVDPTQNEALEGKRAGEDIQPIASFHRDDAWLPLSLKGIVGLFIVQLRAETRTSVDVPPITAITLSETPDTGRSLAGPNSLPRRSVDDTLGLESSSSTLERRPEQVTFSSRAPRDDIPIQASSHHCSPPQYLSSDLPPPPFSSLAVVSFAPQAAAASLIFEPSNFIEDSESDEDPACASVSTETNAASTSAAPAYAPSVSADTSSSSSPASRIRDETKLVLPQDPKGESYRSAKDDDAEPPPAYSEGSSPLPTFVFLMAAAGGASSIITQVQQGGGPINTLGDVAADETITMDLRGTRFTLSRDELLTLPEFVLLSLFPNGLFPDGHMGGFADGDAVQVDVGSTDLIHSSSIPVPCAFTASTTLDAPRASRTAVVRFPTLPHLSATHIRNVLCNLDIYLADTYSSCAQYDPASLQYMLEFFRNVAQTMPAESSAASQDGDSMAPLDPASTRDDSSKRAGIIVLREDLDFYAIPPKQGITQAEMIEVKRAAARALLQQDGIFSGLKKSDEPGTTEAHLIEMLTAGGFNHDDHWGHRAGEPNKAVVCSLALARLRSDIRGNDVGGNAVGMAQKLLLFWRKPARRCWWEGVELENVEGVEGKLKVWIRRVWTLEMSVIGLR